MYHPGWDDTKGSVPPKARFTDHKVTISRVGKVRRRIKDVHLLGAPAVGWSILRLQLRSLNVRQDALEPKKDN